MCFWKRYPSAPLRDIASKQEIFVKHQTQTSTGWLVTAGLFLLSVIPLAGGIFRLIELTGGAPITPANARFFASPLPVEVHIVTGGVFALLGALQLATGLRRRWPAFHRAAGRLVVMSGLLVGLMGVWMTLFSGRQPGTGDVLYALRLIFGSAMIGSLVLGFAAIRRGDVKAHRAIGMGAGTQALTQMVGSFFVSPPTELSTTLLMGAGWVINLAVAEWAIRRRVGTPVRRTVTVIAQT
jgi:uncharacterized membrane protein YozB (DUF420 family)